MNLEQNLAHKKWPVTWANIILIIIIIPHKKSLLLTNLFSYLLELWCDFRHDVLQEIRNFWIWMATLEDMFIYFITAMWTLAHRGNAHMQHKMLCNSLWILEEIVLYYNTISIGIVPSLCLCCIVINNCFSAKIG